MKTLKVIGLLALIMNLTSCNLLFGHDEPEFASYDLSMSFQDASGNDLVKGIGLNTSSGSVKDSLFTLDIIVSEPCKNWDNKIYNTPARPGFEPDVNRPKLGMVKYNSYSYLTSDFQLPVNDCPEEKMLTYKLRCPHVFGDDAIHEFVTYWEIPKDKINQAAKCYRIEFEGNEIIPTPQDKYERSYTATLVLK